MILDTLHPTVDSFAAGTGWKIEPRGACKGSLCVPLGSDALDDAGLDVPTVAERLGMAVVADEARGRWAVGPESFTGRALATVEAPEVELQTFAGEPFRLSQMRGTRMVLVAWAPY